MIVINHRQHNNTHSHDVSHEGHRYRYAYTTQNGTKLDEQLWIIRGCSKSPVDDEDLMDMCHAAVTSAISKHLKTPFMHRA